MVQIRVAVTVERVAQMVQWGRAGLGLRSVVLVDRLTLARRPYARVA